MKLDYQTYLERFDPKKRMEQYDSLRVEPNLFGGYSLIREWGRIGQRGGQSRITPFDDWHKAQMRFWTSGGRSGGGGMFNCEYQSCQTRDGQCVRHAWMVFYADRTA